jgi:hypothetical protein
MRLFKLVEERGELLGLHHVALDFHLSTHERLHGVQLARGQSDEIGTLDSDCQLGAVGRAGGDLAALDVELVCRALNYKSHNHAFVLRRFRFSLTFFDTKNIIWFKQFSLLCLTNFGN